MAQLCSQSRPRLKSALRRSVPVQAAYETVAIGGRQGGALSGRGGRYLELGISALLESIVDIQRDIYLAFAEHIKTFANGDGWTAFLPMGIVFGAVHAMTPGHSKAVLATYLTGSSAGMKRGLLVSIALSTTHVTMAVLIAPFSLPLVSVMLGSAGSAPLLEDLSRGLLGLIGA